jgi:putative transposase
VSILSNDAWPAAVAGLVNARERDGQLATPVVGFTAELCGKSPRTLWRWVNAGAPPSYARSKYVLTDEDLEAYARWHGNVAAVQREAQETRTGAPTLRTLQRAFASQLTNAERAMATRGVPARRHEELNLMPYYDHRNEVWVADHSQLDALVMATRSTRPQRPWSTIFIDAHTRVITGWALSLQPTHATVLAALRRAVLPKQDPAQQLICGRPEMLQTDNGLEFTAERVIAAVNLMEGAARTIRGYSPHLNGLVERVHRTMDQTWLAGSPFYTSASRTHDGQHSRPKNQLPPSFEEFVVRFAEWVRFYNTERPHRGLDGRTPLEAWVADPTPLHVPDETRLDWMLDAPVPRKVRGHGIEIGGLHYSHPALNEHAGRDVDVRTPVNETHFVDVYLGTSRICRATPVGNWTVDDRAAFMEGRRLSRRRLNAAQRQALATQASELDARRALQDETEQDLRDARTATDGALRRSSDTHLLDLDLDVDVDDEAA